jgi:predicted metal-dependent hydrolase
MRKNQHKGKIVKESARVVGGIDALVRYKRIKNMYIRVRSAQGPVEVSVPVYTTNAVLDAFILSRASWIRVQQKRLGGLPRSMCENASKEQIETWRKIIKRKAPSLVEHWSEKIGVHPTEIVYRNMKSVWGNCRPKTGRICLNIRLANYPDECLEYVVVHELCHLIEPSHNARFKGLLDVYLPDWRARKELLK